MAWGEFGHLQFLQGQVLGLIRLHIPWRLPGRPPLQCGAGLLQGSCPGGSRGGPREGPVHVRSACHRARAFSECCFYMWLSLHSSFSINGMVSWWCHELQVKQVQQCAARHVYTLFSDMIKSLEHSARATDWHQQSMLARFQAGSMQGARVHRRL